MSNFIGARLPAGLHDWFAPLLSPGVLMGLSIFSVVTFLASLFGVPYFLAHLPADYFSRNEQRALGLDGPRPVLRIALRVLRNLLGILLILLGVMMLILPGQGLITMLVGAFIVDFPGKRRFERWVVARKSVLLAVNKLRLRAGQPPLEPRQSWFPPSSRQVHHR
jgi:hypothetical protein